MVVTLDGHLFLTLGDRWAPERAQDVSTHQGKIIRIRTDGSVPEDNPFLTVAGAKPEIWTYGHRNPQGLAFDEQSGQLWSHEHGPVGGDELNLIRPGMNYGWPRVTYGLDYSGKTMGESTVEGMEPPLYSWSPAIAPSGLAIESTDEATVLWIGALRGEALIRLAIAGDWTTSEQRFFQNEIGRIRDVRIAADGFLYVITDSATGMLYRVGPPLEQASSQRIGRRRS